MTDGNPLAETRLDLQMQAAQLLIQQLKDFEGVNEHDDADLIRDMIEGETSLGAAIDATIINVANDLSMIEAIKLQEEKLKARRKRLEDRVEKRKYAVNNALRLSNKDRHDNPVCTLSRRKSAPRAEVVDEAALPAKYWRRKDPEVDKRLLLADLKIAADEKKSIHGAALIVGEMSTAWTWS